MSHLKKTIFITAVIIFLLLIIGALSSGNKEASNSTVPSSSQQESIVQKSVSSANDSSAESSDGTAGAIVAELVTVVDGDTFKATINGRSETIRLIGIDTPEAVDPRKPVQCFSEEASARAKELLTGKTIRLETDPSQDERDKYGRLLAYAFLPDGRHFNLLMIASGYAHEYTYDLPYKYQAVFKDAEKNAAERRLGLWSTTTCAGDITKSAFDTKIVYPPTPVSTYTGPYDPFGPDRDCPDFSTHAEAQAFFEAAGGPATDRHRLDRDKDGVACETLP